MRDPLTWVVGAGGLLGSSVASVAGERGRLWAPSSPIHWLSDSAAHQLRTASRDFLRQAAQAPQAPWRVLWCAGAAVTNASPAVLAREAELFQAAIAGLSEAATPGRGSLFLASSAGGVYAGSQGLPFDEHTVPVPLSPYGHGKLNLESVARDFCESTGVPALIGRVSNLYGPNQNIRKPQGLISHLLRSTLLRLPISIFTSMDTLRDYVYAPDAAGLILDALDCLESETKCGAPRAQVKVVASGRVATIGYLVSEISRISKRRPLVVYGTSASAQFQARNLCLSSVVWPEISHRAFTPFSVGILQTLEAMANMQRRGLLS